MATKPSVSTEWATQITNAGASGNLNKEEPTQAFKNFGQPEALPVDRQSLNYELNALDQWKTYFEEKTDELSGAATTTKKGLTELATNQETDDGSSSGVVVVPASLKYKLNRLGLSTTDFVDDAGGKDANDLPHTGRFLLVDATNTPSGGNWFIDNAFLNSTNAGMQFATKLVGEGDEDLLYVRKKSGGWSPWYEVFHTGNNIDARDYGLGVENLNDEVIDFNTVTTTGYKFIVNGSNRPDTNYPAWHLHTWGSNGGNNQVKMSNPQNVNRYYLQSGSTSNWVEMLTTVNISNVAASEAEAKAGSLNSKVMTPLSTKQAYSQWGLGSEEGRVISDWNLAIENGFFKSEGANTYVNSPDNSADGWQGIVTSLNEDNKRQMVFRSGISNYEVWIRDGQGLGGIGLTWQPWKELITQHNIGAYIPNQVSWEKRTSANLPVNSKNLLDLDTLTTFTLPQLSTTSDMDFVTVRPTTSNKSPANFKFTIETFSGDSMKTRNLAKTVVTDTVLEVDLMTEITFINNNGVWEY